MPFPACRYSNLEYPHGQSEARRAARSVWRDSTGERFVPAGAVTLRCGASPRITQFKPGAQFPQDRKDGTQLGLAQRLNDIGDQRRDGLNGGIARGPA